MFVTPGEKCIYSLKNLGVFLVQNFQGIVCAFRAYTSGFDVNVYITKDIFL